MLKTVVISPCQSEDAASVAADPSSRGDLDANMHSDQDTTPHTSAKKKDETVSVRLEKLDTVKKTDKKTSDAEDPKPRIVLTFRSEKPGAKSSNMKIVSTEEKHDEISPRRSNRNRNAKWESDDDNETLVSPKKDKSISGPVSENDEASDSSHTTLKRSARRRSKEFSESILANAIARKEKSYNETASTAVPTQRLSRRIKPTAKILANKELRIGLESQNNARLGITRERSEENIQIRRSTRHNRGQDTADNSKVHSEKKNTKRSYEGQDVEEAEEMDVEDESQNVNRVKKLKHLCELGLKAINPSNLEDGDTENDETREGEEDQETAEEYEDLDEDSEAVSKMVGDGESDSETSDEEFYCSAEATQSDHPRRSTRLCSTYGANDSDRSSPIQADDDQKGPALRRSSRMPTYLRRSFCKAADGDEGSEATCPEKDSKIIATCLCETPSNIYAAPTELTEPVFCQAVELVDGVRVGCSHAAAKSGGEYSPLGRAGPRAPYFMACALHAAQLAQHMCCPACGLFCTQGIFYQCSEGHLFHLECGLPYNDSKTRPGCPHCGVYSYRWQPVNSECNKVHVEMKCSNKRIFLPDQRVQCTQAYLSFSTGSSSGFDQEPVIPEDLLPSEPINLKALRERPESTDYEELLSTTPTQRLCDAIVAGESIEQIISKILSCADINKPLSSLSGGTCVHAACGRGSLSALYALHAAGANLDAVDAASRTPLMVAVLALLDKPQKKDSNKDTKDADKEPVEDVELEQSRDDKCEKEKEEDDKSEKEAEAEGPSDDDLMKVIRYLVAAGCDVNYPGPDGMCALHMAAQHGGERACAACAALVRGAGAAVDARDHGGWTPLVWAAEYGHADVVRLLLSAGASASACDTEGNSVVHWCALAGDARSLRLLLDAAPHAVHATNAHTDTPLHVAARQGHYACVVILLARGAVTTIENSAGELPVEVCTGSCQNAISLNMQMALAIRDTLPRYRMLCRDISNGRESYPVPCVNEVDDEPAPDGFTYVTDHVTPRAIAVDRTIPNMQGCACREGECSSGSCACCVLGVRRWYVGGRLAHHFPYHEPPMLFECNQTCACDLKKCSNSVVSRACSRGSLVVRAVVFRAGGARGWGLRAAAPVARGAPVATYCGELLTLADADARPDDQYMFALDIKPDLLEQCEEKVQLCVDAAKYGSAARFINHSCRPNLAPVRVFTSTRDLRLPTVALFATTDIRAGEEFTFDYGDKFWSVKSKWMNCECGVPECRYPTKTTEEIES